MRQRIRACASICGLGLAVATASAGSHTWDIVEVFSNTDGTIQFIEMAEVAGGASEVNLAGKSVTSKTTGKEFTFPENLDPPSTFMRLLLATEGFANLPDAPTPDYIIEDNFLPTCLGDTVSWHIYDAYTWESGDLPTDGVNSLNRDTGVAANSPTNYAGDSGSVVVPQVPGDLNGDCTVDLTDLSTLLANFGGPGETLADGDLNCDGQVGLEDLSVLLAAFGSSC